MIEAEVQLLALLSSIADTNVEELDCDAFLSRVAPFAEQVSAKVELSDEFFSEAHHIRICAGCREEFEALLASLRGE